MRLRDLGLQIGGIPPGASNTITDVPGLRLGHATARGVDAGITVIQPFGEGPPRRTWVGRWALDGGDDATGLGLADDFGALSTPLVLAPAPAAGRVYDAMIQSGLRFDTGLSEDSGWPPAVLPMNGVPAPAAAVRAAVADDTVSAAFSSLAGGAVPMGQVGVGRGLRAFGGAGGVGTSSRRLAISTSPWTLGVLVAVNAGDARRLRVDGVRVDARSDVSAPESRGLSAAIATLVTDAPLQPQQLERLAGRASFGAVRVGLLDETTHSATVWALSTTAPVDDVDAASGTIDAGGVSEPHLSSLFAAAADTLEESVLDALLATTGARHGVLPPVEWADRVRRGG